MNQQAAKSGVLTLVFVWFTTHFGGGFASGRQIISFFVEFGWYAALMPVIAIGLQAVVFYFAWRYAVEHRLYDYRSWALSFYRPLEGLFSSLFEVMYLLVLLTATAVAFATGGATITTVTGSPYLLNTFIIAAALLLLTIFGADVVRKAAKYIAYLIIAGLLVIYIPNVMVSWPQIWQNVTALQNGALESSGTFGGALWSAILYAAFQTCALGAYLAHSDAIQNAAEAKKAAIGGFILNYGLLALATFGILIYYHEGIVTEAVPALYIVQNGIGAAWMVPLISILIVLGAVSTGVNFIYGMTNRIVTWLGSRDTTPASTALLRKRSIASSSVYVLLTWSIAQFGLIPLVARGYGFLGYVGIVVIIIPVLLKGFVPGLFKASPAAAPETDA